jgi:phosphoenolpyruvate-protein phosphotransferase (PTS system enzyme I)
MILSRKGSSESEPMTASREVTVINKLGVHARPAALFVKTANKFASDITVEKDGEQVNGKSIMGLMMLAAGQGSKLEHHRGGTGRRSGRARAGIVVSTQVRRRVAGRNTIWQNAASRASAYPRAWPEARSTSTAWPKRSSRNTTLPPRTFPRRVARFEQALIKTREQLHELQNRIASGIGSSSPSTILDVHLSITEDPALIDSVINRLQQERKNVEFVFHDVGRKYVTTLSELQDEMFRERAADVQDVTRRIMRNLLGHDHRALTNLPTDTIVVAHELSPSDTTSLDRQHVSGFATDVGSHTSHSAIVARSMNLPAVVGLRNLSQYVHDGQPAILDGYSGTLIVEPSEQTLFIYGQLEVKRHSVQERLDALHDLPAQTLDGHRMILSGNIELPGDTPAVLAAGAEGIGLFRTEFLYLNRSEFPSEEEQYEQYLEVARAVKPHSVIIRTLDIGGDKFRSEDSTPVEVNPFLGFRAIRFCLANVDIFEAQLRAILRASAEGNVRSCIR